MSKLLVGPVVGKVTDTTARVLLEADQATNAVLTVIDTAGSSQQVSAQLLPRTPLGISLGGLTPSTEYQVVVSGPNAKRAARIRTFPPHPSGMNLAVVSCNFTIKRGDTDLWAALRDRYVLPGDVDVLLHMGDQIYGDQTFAWAMNLLNGRAKGTAAQERQVLERYRELYRQTWNYDATADVLAAVPNLMIWDDHDIRDDWGGRPNDRDPGSAEYYVGTLARRVFREYQRQLWDPQATTAPADGFEFHMHAWGEIGVLFVDQRGGRTFQHDAARPYLGTPQWEAIQRALRQGILSKCKALVVVTSVPLAYMGFGVSAVGSNLVDDLGDHWAMPVHRKEQIEFIRALRYWKESTPNRNVFIVGGDVHIGGHTKILHLGRVIFEQLIASTITNKPPSWLAFALMRGLLETNEQLGDNYSFEHHDFTGKRNFGVVLVRLNQAGEPYIIGSLVTS